MFFHILTFGCKVNQYESQALREVWTAQGGRETDAPALAHVVVLNTCAITANAVADARQAVRRVHREAPGASIVVTGCASRLADFKTMPGVARVVEQQDKASLLNFMRCFLENPQALASSEPVTHPQKIFPPFEIHGFRRARPVLKVQDGCSHGCTYCVVPLTRGPSRSRHPQEVLREAQRLLEAGYCEIMLSGINLRHYAASAEGCPDFWDLLTLLERELAPRWAGIARFRLSSVEPAQLDQRGLETLGATSMLCPHLHLSLQSGSPSVLRAMNRGHYRPEQLETAIKSLRQIWPVFGLGADILMGFPGENEDHVLETLNLAATLPLTYAHIFPYSARPGTVAEHMPDQVPIPERQNRAARIRCVVAAKHNSFIQGLVTTARTLVAPDGDGSPKGVNEYYVSCRFTDTDSAANTAVDHTLVPACPVAMENGELLVRRIALRA